MPLPHPCTSVAHHRSAAAASRGNCLQTAKINELTGGGGGGCGGGPGRRRGSRRGQRGVRRKANNAYLLPCSFDASAQAGRMAERRLSESLAEKKVAARRRSDPTHGWLVCRIQCACRKRLDSSKILEHKRNRRVAGIFFRRERSPKGSIEKLRERASKCPHYGARLCPNLSTICIMISLLRWNARARCYLCSIMHTTARSPSDLACNPMSRRLRHGGSEVRWFRFVRNKGRACFEAQGWVKAFSLAFLRRRPSWRD